VKLISVVEFKFNPPSNFRLSPTPLQAHHLKTLAKNWMPFLLAGTVIRQLQWDNDQQMINNQT
jgi:hypothetical protein